MLKSISAVLFLSVCAWAQNPVSDGMRERLKDVEKNTVAAAEEMPAGKYGFKPTDKQATFGHIVTHATKANYLFCSKLTGGKAPDASVKESDPKEKLVAALKQSFQYCSTELPKLQDSQLGQEVLLFGSDKMTVGAALLEVSADWAGHYTQMSGYLRQNGLLPPTAKAEK